MFHSYYIARYVDEIAAAGKAVKPLPMYVNAALPSHRDTWQDPNSYASGGPEPASLTVWRAAAPHIDFAAPDIHNPDHHDYVAFLDAYDRPDNALAIVETGNARPYARYFYAAVGRGALCFSPFGMDRTGYSNFPLGAPRLDDETIEAFALNNRLFAPLVHIWPALALAGKTWGVSEPTDPAVRHEQVMNLGRWKRPSPSAGRNSAMRKHKATPIRAEVLRSPR